MKKRLLTLLLIPFFLQGCEKEDLCNCLESTGGTGEETRLLGEFSELVMNNNIDVVLHPDTSNFLKVICGKNLIDGVKTEISNGKLTLRNINKCNWLRDFKNKFTVEIHFRTLSQITNNGSGNLHCADTLHADIFQVDNWNSTGLMNILINANEVRYKLHTGPADIISSGRTGILYLYTAGNGYMKTAALESDFVYVTTKSTGNCEVFAKNTLDVSIEYNGDIYYKGNPPAIYQKITGSGQLIPF